MGILRGYGCLAAVGLTLFGLGSCEWGNRTEYSNGLRVGVVNKFTEKGLFWKTYEGEMALEGITSSGSTSGANVWDFSLDGNREHGEDTEALATKIRTYAESATKVSMTYRQSFFHWPWRGSTDYWVQTIEPVTGQKPKQSEAQER